MDEKTGKRRRRINAVGREKEHQKNRTMLIGEKVQRRQRKRGNRRKKKMLKGNDLRAETHGGGELFHLLRKKKRTLRVARPREKRDGKVKNSGLTSE